MLQTEPMPPAVFAELQMLVKRLECLRENFDTLANDFGVHLPEQVELPATPDSHPDSPGLDGLRTEICRLNGQVSMIEQLHERLFAARSQLFGLGSAKWETQGTIPSDMASNHGPIRQGDFRAH
ncbi:MAG: hypothetical protein KAV87_56865 [Desulfobacteraceae bacterium]|nr:hypothetical protein [Desulfobacteraceae bacterium]